MGKIFIMVGITLGTFVVRMWRLIEASGHTQPKTPPKCVIWFIDFLDCIFLHVLKFLTRKN